MRPDSARDRQGRHYPAHLDLIGFDDPGPFRVRNRATCLWRTASGRGTRDGRREEFGLTLSGDHPTEAELTAHAWARKHYRLHRNHERWMQICDERVARGEPDPRADPPPCTCEDDCFEVAGCVPGCSCRCELVTVTPEGEHDR